MPSVELAQSIAAAMQLRLPGTAGRVARKIGKKWESWPDEDHISK
jgi:hypothetical protein